MLKRKIPPPDCIELFDLTLSQFKQITLSCFSDEDRETVLHLLWLTYRNYGIERLSLFQGYILIDRGIQKLKTQAKLIGESLEKVGKMEYATVINLSQPLKLCNDQSHVVTEIVIEHHVEQAKKALRSLQRVIEVSLAQRAREAVNALSTGIDKSERLNMYQLLVVASLNAHVTSERLHDGRVITNAGVFKLLSQVSFIDKNLRKASHLDDVKKLLGAVQSKKNKLERIIDKAVKAHKEYQRQLLKAIEHHINMAVNAHKEYQQQPLGDIEDNMYGLYHLKPCLITIRQAYDIISCFLAYDRSVCHYQKTPIYDELDSLRKSGGVWFFIDKLMTIILCYLDPKNTGAGDQKIECSHADGEKLQLIKHNIQSLNDHIRRSTDISLDDVIKKYCYIKSLYQYFKSLSELGSLSSQQKDIVSEIDTENWIPWLVWTILTFFVENMIDKKISTLDCSSYSLSSSPLSFSSSSSLSLSSSLSWCSSPSPTLSVTASSGTISAASVTFDQTDCVL